MIVTRLQIFDFTAAKAVRAIEVQRQRQTIFRLAFRCKHLLHFFSFPNVSKEGNYNYLLMSTASAPLGELLETVASGPSWHRLSLQVREPHALCSKQRR
jgi:hypothetical protein